MLVFRYVVPRLTRELYYISFVPICQPLFFKFSHIFFDTVNSTNMIAVLLRCIIIYALLVVSLRLTGKRQIGELEISELITTLLLSELAAIPVSDPDMPVLFALIPIFVLSALEVLITYFTSKSPRLRSVIAGKPNAVIRNGKIDQGELKKLRMSASELMAQLRINGVTDPASVQYAFFEEDGQMSVIEKDTEYIYTLICDGHLNRFNMKEAGWTEPRIEKFIRSKNTVIDDIFLMTLDPCGKITIIYKEE